VTTRRPKHAGPYDQHDANLWASGGSLQDTCLACNTRGKGKYRKREAS
jgi:hypothetical protein